MTVPTTLLTLVVTVALLFAAVPSYAQDATFRAETDARASTGAADSLRLEDVIGDALIQSPVLEQQQWQVEVRRGERARAAGAFDSRLLMSASNTRSNRFLTTQTTGNLVKNTANVTEYQVGIAKQFVTGLQVEPYLSLNRSETIGSAFLPSHQAVLGTRMQVPLLRGRGADEVAATRRAADRQVRASEQQYRFVASETAFQTVQQYWRFLAARASYRIASESVGRSQRLLRETRLLIEKDERPAADLVQPQANLADKQAQRLSAARALAAARRDLSIVVGYDADASARLALAHAPFPEVTLKVRTLLDRPDAFVQQARVQRTDLRAARVQQEAAQVLVESASDSRLPRLDVSVDVSYAGSGLSNEFGPYLSPFGHEQAGLNATVGLQSDLAFRNRTASGETARQRAVLRQQVIATEDLARTIDVQIRTTVSLLKASIEQLDSSREAVDLYSTVIDNERTRYTLGMSTLFDVILAEERLTAALTNHVQNQSQYAILLAQIRFQTGTLLAFDQNRASVIPERLISLPVLN